MELCSKHRQSKKHITHTRTDIKTKTLIQPYNKKNEAILQLRSQYENAKKNLEKLNVKGPIAPMPVVCETNAVPHIKEAINIKKFAFMWLI